MVVEIQSSSNGPWSLGNIPVVEARLCISGVASHSEDWSKVTQSSVLTGYTAITVLLV